MAPFGESFRNTFFFLRMVQSFYRRYLQNTTNNVTGAQEDQDRSRYAAYSVIYIYNSVLTRRHRHINSSASTPQNATKIAEMKVSHHGLEIVGPELLFSIYKCCFFGVCLREVETQSG